MLVFWLQTLVNIVALIFAVIKHDFGYVLVRFFRSIVTLSQGVNLVDPGSWSGVFLISSLISPAFFLLLLSFLKDLHIISILRSCHFLSLDLDFFNLKIIQWATPGVGFGCNSVDRLKTSRIVLIYLLNNSIKPEWCFTLDFYDFLYILLKTLQLQILIF